MGARRWGSPRTLVNRREPPPLFYWNSAEPEEKRALASELDQDPKERAELAIPYRVDAFVWASAPAASALRHDVNCT